jgi:hypothetical protein
MNIENRVINYKNYNVFENEFKQIECNFSTLIVRDKLGYYERIISLLCELGKSCSTENALFISPTHGGYIPLECSPHFKYLFLYDCKNNIQNINYNKSHHKVNNFCIVNDLNNINNIHRTNMLLFMEDFVNDYDDFIELYKPIIVGKINKKYSNYFIYHLTNTELFVLIPMRLHYSFLKDFHTFIPEKSYELAYDNLINICIMVKNGGDKFEEMLTKNLPFVDYWTILDTGSTDNTIDIINKVLVNKKKGALYQEPFINFGASRNRCLELAGTQCKFNIMLDDTYILGGHLREFLDYVRGDQFTDSFSLYINQNDIEYASNRIFKSAKKLQYLYTIHEVIQDYDNVNVIIPNTQAHIYDVPSPDMTTRTFNRKESDLVLLFEEIRKNPDDPRAYYYVGQTYNLLQKHEKAYEYYLARGNHAKEGFIQEKVDALFEAGRIANFSLNRPWEECEKLYKRAYELDTSRPESLYFLGVHYYLEGNIDSAYEYLLKGFENGYPIHRQYCLKPTLCYTYLPKILAFCCYQKESYEIGEKACELFLEKNKPDAEQYDLVVDWHKIFVFLNKSRKNIGNMLKSNYSENPLCVFVTPGGFTKWTGRDILSNGMGGSETYVVEMARYIQKQGYFKVVVFCDCHTSDIYEGVAYRPLEEYFEFVNQNYIHTCFVSRYSEYLPVALKGQTMNVYLLVHDLRLTGLIVPMDQKLKKIFCLSDWHVEYFTNMYPDLKDITVSFGYGMDLTHFVNTNVEPVKQPYKFIYSSLANRGLLQLLIMWSKIHCIQPLASLHIYCDINSNYMMTNYPELMQNIRNLIDKLGNANVFYYGWSSKKVLMDAWKTTDVWFYPCTYAETFCLTGYEAAASKTLVVTNDLAALQTTVGDRGVIIKGLPDSVEWFDTAIDKLFEILANPAKKRELIEKNYAWVCKYSWEQRANEMLQTYLLPGSSVKASDETTKLGDGLAYDGMYNWTNDVPEGSRFESIIQYFNYTHKSVPTKVLAYTGTSLINIVKMIPNSRGVAIEESGAITEKIEENQIMNSFISNVNKSGLKDRVTYIRQDSTTALIEMVKTDDKYDFIYVGASHTLCDCYGDLLLAWNVLNKGGVLGIDDYLWKQTDTLGSPFEAVNHFLKKYEKEMVVLSKEYRVFVEKK